MEPIRWTRAPSARRGLLLPARGAPCLLPLVLVAALRAPQEPVAPGPAEPADLAAELDESLATLVDSEPLPGLAVGIVSGSELAYARGFGLADLDDGRPVDEGTLFQIGSVTKAFTSTLLALLVAEGRLGLDDELGAFLDLPPSLQRGGLTLRLVACHRAGLPGRAPTLPADVSEGLVRSFSHFELERSLARAELESEPGERFAYSNFGYALLGNVLERVTDTSFEPLLRERLLDPLGMRDSTITLYPRHVERLATPYRKDADAGVFVRTLPQDLDALAPAGGLWSCVRDLAPFVALHLGALAPAWPVEPGPTPELLAELHAALPIRPGDSMGYGLGWGRDEVQGLDVVFHDGGSDGYTAYVGLAPAEGVGAIVLCNLGSEAAARVVRGLGHGLLVRAAQAR